MPASKKKRITAENALSRSQPSSPMLPEQQEFHQHLRALAQSAVQTVLELVMREELDAFIGAAWGESSPKRKGYRNGHYTRDLVTSTGRLEDLQLGTEPRTSKARSLPGIFAHTSLVSPLVVPQQTSCTFGAPPSLKMGLTPIFRGLGMAST